MNYFKGLPNFKEHRMKMVWVEYPEYIFEVLRKFWEFMKDLNYEAEINSAWQIAALRFIK
jgi:hypothetical protein